MKNLANQTIPSYRQAYSDRTAYTMACLSELAYLRFNPLISKYKKDFFIKNITNLIDGGKKNSLLKLIDIVGYDHNEENKKLIKELASLNFTIVEKFDSEGTQAILVTNNEYLVLAFRGTEATSIKDIKSDFKATTQPCTTNGKVHSGFQEAFDKVVQDIEQSLNSEELKNKPLFITGHSLGGALATIATKQITHTGGNAGCYTFGSPRVGDEDWIYGLKTPIYRIVNAADCVTMLPPSDELISIISWFVGFLSNNIKKLLLSKFGGYLHGGNMRYMTNCPKGDYKNVKLLYSVSFFRRIKALIIKKLPWKKVLSDHSITVYRKKLFIIAQKRNQ